MNTSQRELSFTREVPLSASQLYRAWTEPDLLVQWFTPRPWTTVRAQLDVRPGGQSLIVMRSPEGVEFPNPGVYLEVIPNRRIVFTNAFTKAWEPLELKPDDPHAFLMVGSVGFEEMGESRAVYTACVRHWTAADCAKHAAMGFHEGWNRALDQLIELMAKR